MGLRSNEGLSEGDKVKGEGDRETDQELEKEIQGMGVRDIVQKIAWKGDYNKKNKEWWVREREKSDNRKRAEIDRKTRRGEGNNKKDGKEVMMELDISSQVEDTGRLPLKELNQNSRIRYGRERL